MFFVCNPQSAQNEIQSFKGSVPLKKGKNWNVNYAFVWLQTIKFTLFSEKSYVIVCICGQFFSMEVINLAGLPDVGNTEKSRNL